MNQNKLDSDGFTLVQRKKKGKRPEIQRNGRKIQCNAALQTPSVGRCGVDKANVVKKLRASREELVISDFYSRLKDSLKSVFDLEPMSATDPRTTGPVAGKCGTNDGAVGFETDRPSADVTLKPAEGTVERNPSKNQFDDHLQNRGIRTKTSVEFHNLKEVANQDCADVNCQILDVDVNRTEARLSDGLGGEKLVEAAGQGNNHAGGRRLVQSVVCYGLGNFSDSVIARYQLALLLLICEFLKISLVSCSVFDPVFTPEESEILGSLGMEVIHQNEDCKREVSQSTLFYMPHCGKPLYNNLLWANWRLDRLSNVIIIGNSFSHIKERLPSRILEKDFVCLHQIMPYTTEVPVGNNFRFTDIFNDTAIHVFPWHRLRKIPDAFWERPDEPQYDPDFVLD